LQGFKKERQRERMNLIMKARSTHAYQKVRTSNTINLKHEYINRLSYRKG